MAFDIFSPRIAGAYSNLQHFAAKQYAVNNSITQLHVFAISDRAPSGILRLGNLCFPCLLGAKGRTCRKREGDGKSPRGRWLVTSLYFRPDRARGIKSARRLKPNDGWCDAPEHPAYNHKITWPFAASLEKLWRNDDAYDILAITNHNQRPRRRGAGSAIFLHLWREGATGTEGCIALRRRDMLVVLSRLRGRTYLVI